MDPLGPDDVKRWADHHGIFAELHLDMGKVHTVQQAAEALDVPPAAVAKTVVFAHTGGPLAVIAPGTAKVREKDVIAHVGGSRKSLRMADPSQVLEWTGYPVGAVPPVAHVKPLRILMDAALVPLGRAVFGGGAGDALVTMVPAEILAVTGADVGAFCAPTA